jgi:hypothetical protein
MQTINIKRVMAIKRSGGNPDQSGLLIVPGSIFSSTVLLSGTKRDGDGNK